MSTCASELPHIVSLASGALALNLAYLNLERFRYAKAILNSAKEVMDRLEKDQELDFTQTRSYKQLKALVEFPTSRKENGDAPQELGAFLGTIKLLYRWLFVRPPMDRIFCTAFVIASVTAVVLGAGHPIGVFQSTCQFFDTTYISLSYWALVAGIIMPMVFLVLGGFIQQTCLNLAERIEGDLGQVMQRSAREARVEVLADDQGIQ